MVTSPDPVAPRAPDVVSFGCRLNAAEGDTVRALSASAGLSDAVIVNTCAVTNEAVRQAEQAIRRTRRSTPGAAIIVTGCAAQIEPARFAAMPGVAAVLGNAEKLDPASWRSVAAAVGDAGARPEVRVNDIMGVRATSAHFVDAFGERARAFLEVQNGCDHRCTFCIIPFGRGPARSASIDAVVSRARQQVDAGFHELVLTGVDLTSWGRDLEGAPNLGDLVAALLDRVSGLSRLRLSSVDPAEIDAQLFERLAEDQRLAPHLHLSLQSGDDLILKRMRRRHRRADAIDLCAALRARRPGIAFGADLIVGFPTETETMFARTLDIVDAAGLSFLHVFAFSPKAGTPAARMPQVDLAIRKDRARRLRCKGEEALRAFLSRLVGETHEAIVESGGRARLGNFAVVDLGDRAGAADAAARGALVRVNVTGMTGLMLEGRIVDAALASPAGRHEAMGGPRKEKGPPSDEGLMDGSPEAFTSRW